MLYLTKVFKQQKGGTAKVEEKIFDLDKLVEDMASGKTEFDFDKIAQNYDEMHQIAIKASGYSADCSNERKVIEMHRVLSKRPGFPAAPSILDFGCGVGSIGPYLRKYFPDSPIYGVDISEQSIRVAKENRGERFNITYRVIEERGDDFLFGVQFDLIFVSGVFHHIARKEHPHVFFRIKALLKPGGLLYCQEVNPYNPAARVLVFNKYDKRVDPNANMLSSSYMRNQLKKAEFLMSRSHYEVFFPAFLSALLPLEKYIAWLPFGARYYIIAENPKN